MDFLFLFKKIASRFFFPASLIFYPLLIGLILLLFTRKQTAGKVFVSIAFVLFYAMSTSFLPGLLLRPLEHRFPAYDGAQVAEVRGAEWKPDYILILGGDAYTGPGVPVEFRLGERTHRRLAEGVRLARLYPESTLIMTGGPAREGQNSLGAVMAEVATQWGISAERIQVEGESRDTRDHVRLLEDQLEEKPFIIVTSATHMLRAVSMFRHEGMDPVAAPAGFMTWKEKNPDITVRERIQEWLPRTGNLNRMEAAIYEYLGLAWAWIRDQA